MFSDIVQVCVLCPKELGPFPERMFARLAVIVGVYPQRQDLSVSKHVPQVHVWFMHPDSFDMLGLLLQCFLHVHPHSASVSSINQLALPLAQYVRLYHKF